MTSGVVVGRRALLRLSASAVTVSTSTVLPLFLTAGLAVQVSADLAFPASALGAAPAAFFGASALVSPFAGATVERFGPLRAMRVAVFSVAGVLITTAVLVNSLAALLCFLALAGAANALGQPAVNLYLAQRVPANRQGTAYGTKHSAIPAAALLAGLAVPVLGLTIGWRWAFGAFGGIAAAVAVFPRSGEVPAGAVQVGQRMSGRLPRRPLLVMTVGAGLAAACGSALGIFLVAGAVETGWGEAQAGLLFAAASAVGIAARMTSGAAADHRGRNHFPVIAAMLVVGSVGVAALALGGPALFVVGALLAFGAGWGWPGLFILAVVQLNPSAPAAATGITQAGTSAGAVTGPLVFGLLVETTSYAVAWWATGATMLVAAVVLVSVRRRGDHELAAATDRGTSRARRWAVDGKGEDMEPQDLVESYFASCSAGDAAAIARHFCSDAVVYDLNHDPVRGAERIGDFFVRVRQRWGGAVWEVNTFLGHDAAAAIEWTMRGRDGGDAFVVRGSEHYEFREGRISEIRQYWIFDRTHREVGLRDFPYQRRTRFAPGRTATDSRTSGGGG